MERIWVGRFGRQHPANEKFQAVLAVSPSAFAPESSADHQHGDDSKPDSQADPDADTFPAARERQPHSGAESDDPVAEEGEQHRDARVVKAAQHSGTDDLRAVEDLEDRGNGQELHREHGHPAAARFRSRKNPTSVWGIAHISSAMTVMNATPSTHAVQPARVIAVRSPAPRARPTRTVAAWLKPQGTMKASAAICRAMAWPARLSASIRPMR